MPKKFSITDGTDGETLGCDCYGGCWGDHSENWPKLQFSSKTDAELAFRLCHQSLSGEPLPRGERVGHGNYVLMGDHSLRFATKELRDAHVQRLESVLGW